MKKLITPCFLFLFFISCTSPQELLELGQYDEAIHKAQKRFEWNGKEKHIVVLEKAFELAVDKDKELIGRLKSEGNPENLDEIVKVYWRLQGRQNIIKPLLPLHIKSESRDAVFEIQEYSSDIEIAKQKAAEYHYTKGLNLLENPTKKYARQAYYEFQKVNNYFSNYRETNSNLALAKNLGTIHVFYDVQNSSGYSILNNLEKYLAQLDLSDFDENMLMFHEQKNEGCDFTLKVRITTYGVSDNNYTKSCYTDQKEVCDGWEYVLDCNGKKVKGENGKYIKREKFKTIYCQVTQFKQYKSATVYGVLEFIDNKTGTIIKSKQIYGSSYFENCYAIANGDLNALSGRSLDKINKGYPVSYPDDQDMVNRTWWDLKSSIRYGAKFNKDIFVNNI